MAKALQAKELRLCQDAEENLKTTKGCITCLSLFYDKANNVTWAIDKELLANEEADICICAGCSDPLDHAQHNIVNMHEPAGAAGIAADPLGG